MVRDPKILPEADKKTFYENIKGARNLLESAGWREGAGQHKIALGQILFAEEQIKKAKAQLRRVIREQKRRAA